MNQYLSPFGTRYGSDEMARIWSEKTKRTLWRDFWWKLLLRQAEDGLIPGITQHELDIVWASLTSEYTEAHYALALEKERETRHDLFAELECAREEAAAAGFKRAECLHLGATSSDVEDYADAIRISESIRRLTPRMLDLAEDMAGQVLYHADLATPGSTHLQTAEPTTLGYRMATYLSNYWRSVKDLLYLPNDLWVHAGSLNVGGAVGVSSNLLQLAEGQSFEYLRSSYSSGQVRLQTANRIDEVRLAGCLAAIAASLHKMALDFRLMQSMHLLEELRGERQIGSSAMPGKRNPMTSENSCALARHIRSLYLEVWDYAAHTALDRTLDDSAPRRYVLAELFLASEQLVTNQLKVINNLVVHRDRSIIAAIGEAEPVWLASRIYTLLRANGQDVSQSEALEYDLNKLKDEGITQRIDPHLEEAGHRAVVIAKTVLSEIERRKEYHGQS